MRVRVTIVAEKAIIVKYSECVFVASFIQHAMRTRNAICGLPLSTVFLRYLITARFSEKSNYTQNVCFDFLYNICLKHFSF
jgi:hypothetical protein